MRAILTFFAVLLGGLHTAAAEQPLWSEKGPTAPLVAQLPNFSCLAAQVTPAVVSIQVDQKVKMNRPGLPEGFPFDFFFRPFAPGPQQGPGGPRQRSPQEFHNQGIGSGFVIREDGLVLTNYHVIENADSIEVLFEAADGSKENKPAKVLGKAPDYDVALLQVQDTQSATKAYLGDSAAVDIGSWVMAIGTPFGLSHSVSVGIISAKERRNVEPSGRAGLYDFLQTDASVNPGNSGGPLINMRGEVIGINTAINASGSGIGFAIPINMVKAMLSQLKTTGEYARSWIGVRIQPLTDDLAQSYGLKKGQGALVAEVVPDSPAAKAKLRPEDIILKFDGKVVRQSSDLQLWASMAGVGSQANLTIWRDRRLQNLTLTLERLPSEAHEEGSDKTNPEDNVYGPVLGMSLTDLTASLRQRLGIDTEEGVLVAKIEPDSPGARAGIRPGDVVTSVNGRSMQHPKMILQILQKLPSGSVLRLRIARADGRLFIALRKP